MTPYVWQLGIDWNAIQTGGVGYLRGGLGKKTTDGGVTTFEPLAGTNRVQPGDQITFRIFDVTSSAPPVPHKRWVTAIGSFGIDSQAAVKDQSAPNPFNDQPPFKTQLTFASSSTASEQSSLFGSAYCSWDYEPLTVTATSGRFLLTVYLQAIKFDGVIRLFNHDPEMVVGASL